MLNEDYKDILRILLRDKVKFLIVGAYSMAAHGYPRATGDFDIWVESSPENSKKVYNALKEFGASLSDINENIFSEEGVIFQIGVVPRRIDIITKISGVEFKNAYPNRETIKIEGLTAPIISKKDLIRNKSETGREKDVLDAKYLRKRARKR